MLNVFAKNIFRQKKHKINPYYSQGVVPVRLSWRQMQDSENEIDTNMQKMAVCKQDPSLAMKQTQLRISGIKKEHKTDTCNDLVM